MNLEFKDNYLRSYLKFVLKNEDETDNHYKKKLLNLSKKIQSAVILNMEIFRNERMKDLDIFYKSSQEELVENSALRILRNEPKNIDFSGSKFDHTELWKVQKQGFKFEEELEYDNHRQKRKNKRGREGIISNTKKLITFDKEKYDEQMQTLRENPEKFENLRTSHLPSIEDKNILISQYLKHQRRKPLFDNLDSEAQVYHISRDNLRYNEKLDRAYHEYTEEIKQNLERGTAI